MTDARPKLLIVDDEAAIRTFLTAAIDGAGYVVTAVATGQEALSAVMHRPPDLMILDIGLPDLSGQEVLVELRTWSKLPVIVLSAVGHELQKVEAFAAGADDYLTKPFGVPELLARVRAVLRRAGPEASGESSLQRYEVGELVVDFTARRVFIAKREIRLTPTEYRLLSLMARHAGKVLTHPFLLSQVWGEEHVAEVNYLRVFMAGLRRKLEIDSAQPRYLITEQGVGYRLADE